MALTILPSMRLSIRNKLRYGVSAQGIVFFLFASIFSILPLSLVIFTDGWPVNHEMQQFFIRTYVWADHIRAWDIFPLWSSSDAYGYGTPLPTYYQKLFHSVNALLFIAFGSIKAATVTTLFCFFMSGIYGLRASLRYLVRNKELANIFPLVFPLTSYVVTDWLVRGAMAEMSAIAIVPWVIWWCIKVLKTNQISYWIILIFPALFYAHNAIALIALIFVGVAIILMCLRRTQIIELIRNSWRKCIICGAGVAGLIFPSLILQSMMNADYNPADKIDDVYNIQTSFQQPGKYLLDREYVWLQSGVDYTIQLDIVLWLSIIAATVGLVVCTLFKREGRLPVRDVSVWVITLSLCIYLLLQLEVASIIYEAIPILALIQFPWRMLSIITPLLLLILGVLVDHVYRAVGYSRESPILFYGPFAAWTILYVALSPVAYVDQIERMSIINHPSGAVYAGGEYLPVTYTNQGELLGNEDMLTLYRDLTQVLPDARIIELDGATESTVRNFRVNSDDKQEIALPISYSRYMRVIGNGKPLRIVRNLHDPRLRVVVPAGEVYIKVELPTVRRVIYSALGS